ncbi:hypothetical protein [Spiroplasma endosymbiont of Dactylopius coccus]
MGVGQLSKSTGSGNNGAVAKLSTVNKLLILRTCLGSFLTYFWLN